MGYTLFPKTIAEVAGTYARKLGVQVEFDWRQARAYSTPNKIVLPALNLENLAAERILYGLMAHEAGHIHYSDFSSFASVDNPLVQDLVNALEDCRIEHLMSQGHLGVFENLEYTNQCVYHYQFKHFHLQQPMCKLKLIISFLLVKTHSVLLHYNYADTIAKLVSQELSGLIPDKSLKTLDEFTHQVGLCQSTHDIIELAHLILQAFYTKGFFVPNFEHFVLSNNSISAFDFNHAKELATLYGQSFNPPVLCPHKQQAQIVSCQSIIDAHLLKLSESDLNDNFLPSFIAPHLYPIEQVSDNINVQDLVNKTSLSEVQRSLERSHQAVGNLEEALYLCKSTHEKSKIHYNYQPPEDFSARLLKLYQSPPNNSPSTSSQTPPSPSFNHFSCAALAALLSNQAYHKEVSSTQLNTSPLSRLRSPWSPTSDSILSYVTSTATKQEVNLQHLYSAALLSPMQSLVHDSPYSYGADDSGAHHKITYKSPVLLHSALEESLHELTNFKTKYLLTKDMLNRYIDKEMLESQISELAQMLWEQHKAAINISHHDLDLDKEQFAPVDNIFNPLYSPYASKAEFLEHVSDYQNFLQEHLDKRSPYYIRATCFNAGAFISQDFKVLNHELSVTGKDLKLYDYFIKPDISLELATRLFVESLSNPMRFVPLWRWVNIFPFIYVFQDFVSLNTMQEQRLAYIQSKLKRKLYIPHSLKENRQLNKRLNTTIKLHNRIFNTTYFNARTFKEAEKFQQEGVRFPAFQYEEAPEELQLMCLDKGYRFNPLRKVQAHDCLVQELMEDRVSAKLQRQEAILKEMGLADEFSLDPDRSLDPNMYCRDKAGHVYLKYYYERSVIAKKALLLSGLNDSKQAIAPVLDKNHFSGILHYSRMPHKRPEQSKAAHDSMLETYHKVKPRQDYLHEIFYKVPCMSPWTVGSTQEPQWRFPNLYLDGKNLYKEDPVITGHKDGSLKRACECPFNLKKQPVEVQRQNSLYLRYCRFLNNLVLPNAMDISSFHKAMLSNYSQYCDNRRDPRAENTFADALREYYVERFIPTNSPNYNEPSCEESNHIERYQQELKANKAPEPTEQVKRPPGDTNLLNRNMFYDLRKFSVQDLKEMAVNAEILKLQRHPDFKLIEQELKRRIPKEDLHTLYSKTIPKIQSEFIHEALTEQAAIRQALENKLMAYYQHHYQLHMPKGRKLNISKAQRIFLGETKIFDADNPNMACDTVVHLLIDISSSMANERHFIRKEFIDKDCAGYVACKSALSIALALSKLEQVHTEATFFPGPCQDKPYINILGAHENVTERAKYFLQLPRLFTPTAEALTFVVASLNRHTNKRKIIILLTDGMPDQVSTTKRALRLAEKCDIEIYSLGIGIAKGLQPIVNTIFPNMMNIQDYQQLPQALSRLIGNRFTLP